MNIEEFRDYCLMKKGVTEEFPFDDNALVFKVMGKMFTLTSLKKPFWINLKCDPERALELRASHPSITAGYHMNKKHWNTIAVDGSIDDKFLYDLIDHSYELVVASLTKKLKLELDGL